MAFINLTESASPGTPSAGTAYVYVDNTGNPLLKMTDDSGTVTVVGRYWTGRATAQTAAVASVVAFTVGSSDASFLVSANLLVTTSTTYTFNVECAYTDEGNTARTLLLAFRLVGSTTAVLTSIANGDGAVPRLGLPSHIRCKAGTTITIRTQAAGTYTTVTYNIEGIIQQVS